MLRFPLKKHIPSGVDRISTIGRIPQRFIPVIWKYFLFGGKYFPMERKYFLLMAEYFPLVTKYFPTHKKAIAKLTVSLAMALRPFLICTLRVLNCDGCDFVGAIFSSYYFVHLVAFIIGSFI